MKTGYDNILKVLKNHLAHCKMHEFSLQADRHCTCGVEKAREELESFKNIAEILRRYMIYEELYNGYEILAAEFGACEHPESSVWFTEWLERVLRNPARIALAK